MDFKFLRNFSNNINQLRDLCESPIEIKVLDYILETVFDSLNSDFNEINSPSIRFISEYVFKQEYYQSFSGSKRFFWNECDEIFYKIKGIELQFLNSIPAFILDSDDILKKYEMNTLEFENFKKKYESKGAQLSDDSYLTNVYKIEIIPQYEVVSKLNKKFRLDFGVVKSTLRDNKIVTLEKSCIECDGHDYHSTKEQITRDNARARELTLEGWKIYRFSGSEIQIRKNVVKFLTELFS